MLSSAISLSNLPALSDVSGVQDQESEGHLDLPSLGPPLLPMQHPQASELPQEPVPHTEEQKVSTLRSFWHPDLSVALGPAPLCTTMATVS